MINVTIIVPCYNEEEMLPIFFKKIEELFVDNNEYNFDFLMVNDGSKDKTLSILQQESSKKDNISYISLSKNYGQDAALSCGLQHASGDCVIMMDCDMQDPPELIFEMLKKYQEGYEIVNPQRVKRDEDTAFKRKSSGLFYKFINKIAGREVIPPNVSQFRLLSRKAVNYVNSLPESSRMIRGEIPYIGLKTCTIPFERKARVAGKTKYNFKKMLDGAFKTITSATNNLLDFVLKFGIVFCIVGFLGLIACFISYCCLRNSSLFILGDIFIPTIVFASLFVAGLVLSVMYIPMIYLKDIMVNTQKRPNYFIGEEYYSKKAIDNVNKK